MRRIMAREKVIIAAAVICKKSTPAEIAKQYGVREREIRYIAKKLMKIGEPALSRVPWRRHPLSSQPDINF